MKRLRVLETELFHLFADMIQCKPTEVCVPSCPAPDLAPDLEVGISALSCLPQAGVPPSGAGAGAQIVAGARGHVRCQYRLRRLSAECPLCPSPRSARPGLSSRRRPKGGQLHELPIASWLLFAHLPSRRSFPRMQGTALGRSSRA